MTKYYFLKFFVQNNKKLSRQNHCLGSLHVATPLWVKCEDETHTPKSGNLESSRTPENLELNCRGQNTSHWGVLYTIGKVLKCRCPKWPRMSHLDIFSTSYGQKKGRFGHLHHKLWSKEGPLKVGNRLDPGACRSSVTCRWKALDESYNFGSDLISIQARGEKLWMPKVPGVQTGTISGLHFGSPRKKSHLDASAAESCREYYKGEGGGFPRVRAVVSQVSPSCLWLVPTPKGCRMNSNQLVG
jgi:hypothetical protein